MKEKICIYCRGRIGLQAYFILREVGIEVAYFADKDISKQGMIFPDLRCISYQELLLMKNEKLIIIVANVKSKQIKLDFKEKGFKDVYTWQEYGSQIKNDIRIENNLKSIQIYLNELKVCGTSETLIDDLLMRKLLQDIENRQRMISYYEGT